MSVHAKGVIRFPGESGLEDALRKTSLHFENDNPDSTASYDNLPSAFKQSVMKAILAFEIDITAIDTIFKLSQNRDAESYQNIIEKLKEQGEVRREIAAKMEKRTRDVFPNGIKYNYLPCSFDI